MNAPRLKQKFIDFFLSKGHQEIPSASLIPENDPTTLFISAGMHPLVPFLLGTPHTLGKRLVDVQKCLRTRDIDEVGDTFHHTFFEMLGNWSLGDYFKKDMIAWSYEFLTKQLNLNPQHLHITCFAGDTNAPKDEQSAKFWRQLGIPESRIHFLPKKDNWWGPAGATGPCGPDSEMFIDTQPQQPSIPFDQACRQGRIIEIWNDVFMQYNKDESSKYHLLSQQNVDTGMGVERTVAILNGFSDNYLTDIWQPIIQKIEQLSSQKYSQQPRPMRIMADH
ncbi:alanine--tRNA ligase, partial [Candidatus Shapirobacteria bacterium]